MFGIDFGQLKIVRYTYPPKPEGRLWTAFGVLCLLVTVILGVIDGFSDIKGLAILAAISVAQCGYGLYCWKLRRRPVKRQVTLGGPAHRLYVRSRWMFVVYGLACACVEYAVVMALVSLLESGADMGEVFLERLRGLFVLLLVMFYRVFFEYLSYYQYFHMPESSRRDLFTEAVKQMNEDGKKRE